MARRCTICQHDRREEIEQAIVAGESFRGVARRFAVSPDAAERHAKAHVPAALARASGAAAVARGDDLLGEVRDLQARAAGILDKAEQSGDLRTALAAVRELRGCLELLVSVATAAIPAEVQRRLEAEALPMVDELVAIVQRHVPDATVRAAITAECDEMLEQRERAEQDGAAREN